MPLIALMAASSHQGWRSPESRSRVAMTARLLITLIVCVGCKPETPSTPLQDAVFSNDTKRVDELLNAGSSPKDKVDALVVAASYGSGRADIAKALLKAGADPQTALERASGFPDLEMVKLLVNAGARPDPTVIQSAACCGVSNAAVLAFLLDQSPSIEQFYLDDALRAAARHGKTDNAKVLLQRGADPDAEYSNTKSALAEARGASHWDTVEVLNQGRRHLALRRQECERSRGAWANGKCLK
jgi:ankyrin repeat protein